MSVLPSLQFTHQFLFVTILPFNVARRCHARKLSKRVWMKTHKQRTSDDVNFRMEFYLWVRWNMNENGFWKNVNQLLKRDCYENHWIDFELRASIAVITVHYFCATIQLLRNLHGIKRFTFNATFHFNSCVYANDQPIRKVAMSTRWIMFRTILLWHVPVDHCELLISRIKLFGWGFSIW